MEHKNPGQVEAALKTFANSGEICGVAFGIWFLLGALSMLFIKKGSVSGKLAIAGVSMIAGGFAIVWFVNFLVNELFFKLHVSTYDAEPWLIGIGYAGFALVIAFAFACFFFPTIVAFKRRKQNQKIILLLNVFIGAIPLGWNTVLFLSFKDDKGKIDIGSKEAVGKRVNEV